MLIYDMKIFLLILSSILISGCATKANQALLVDFGSKSQELSQTLQTQKVTILNSKGGIDGFVTALYLYDKSGRITTNKGENEKFIIGVYHDNRSDNIQKPTVSLFGIKPISFRSVGFNDKVLESIPLKNQWSRYYEVTFPPYSLNDDMELRLVDSELGIVMLKFSKALNFSKDK